MRTALILSYPPATYSIFFKLVNYPDRSMTLKSYILMKYQKEKKEKCSRREENPIPNQRLSLSPCSSVTGTSVETFWIVLLNCIAFF